MIRTQGILQMFGSRVKCGAGLTEFALRLQGTPESQVGATQRVRECSQLARRLQKAQTTSRVGLCPVRVAELQLHIRSTGEKSADSRRLAGQFS